jgi:hypothetical protein
MNLNLEVNKKLVAITLAIGSLTLTLIGFITSDHIENQRANSNDIMELKINFEKFKQKVDDDNSQWITLQQQAEKANEQEVQIRVLKLMVQNMSRGKEVILKLEEDGSMSVPKSSEIQGVKPVKALPMSESPEIPEPVEAPAIEAPAIEAPEIPEPVDPLREAEKTLIEKEKALIEMKRRMEELEQRKKYEDFRRDKMMEQRAIR